MVFFIDFYRVLIVSEKVDVDHLLDVKIHSGKFDYICSYALQMHSEQTKTILYILRRENNRVYYAGHRKSIKKIKALGQLRVLWLSIYAKKNVCLFDCLFAILLETVWANVNKLSEKHLHIQEIVDIYIFLKNQSFPQGRRQKP